jgi:hypothetical protein
MVWRLGDQLAALGAATPPPADEEAHSRADLRILTTQR